MHRRPERNHLIGVDAFVGRLAKELFDHALDHRDSRRATNEDDLADIGSLLVSVLESGLEGLNGSLNDGLDHLLELGATKLDHQVLGTAGIRREERKIDLRLLS